MGDLYSRMGLGNEVNPDKADLLFVYERAKARVVARTFLLSTSDAADDQPSALWRFLIFITYKNPSNHQAIRSSCRLRQN